MASALEGLIQGMPLIEMRSLGFWYIYPEIYLEMGYAAPLSRILMIGHLSHNKQCLHSVNNSVIAKYSL